jgi:NAD(P)-dependent dehydrogenase (short-subunit alcohol dehydrogenase family)
MNTTEFFSLKGEVAVVIGATGVLGGALADGVCRRGCESCRAGPQ